MKKILAFIQQYSLYLFLVYATIITVASLVPNFSRHYQTGEIALGLTPKNGDNFKIVNLPAVYRLENGKRHQYLNDTSFFSYPENKAFDTPYDKGGILICDPAVLQQFPRGDYMPEKPGDIAKKHKEKTFRERVEKTAFRSDKLGHFGAYLVFAFLFMLTLQQLKVEPKWLQILIVLGLGTLLGGTIEWAQFNFVPGRDKELLDFMYNVFGLIVGVLVGKKFEHLKILKLV